MIPGTTPERSAKAMKRVRRAPIEPEDIYDVEDPAETWDAKPKVMKTSEGLREFFTIKYLAQAWDNRTIQSIRKLEREGVIPKAKYRSKVGKRRDRLYSREQIEMLVAVAKRYDVYETNTRKNIVKTGFTDEVLRNW